jgi:hypothetical protein
MKPDCRDSACLFTEYKSGTDALSHGGCKCLENAGFDPSPTKAARQMLPELLQLRERVKELEEDLENERNEYLNLLER